MAVELTPAEARRLGIKVPKGTRTKRKDYSEVRGPYRWRCRCGVEGDGEKAATAHVAPGHNCFETVLDG